MHGEGVPFQNDTTRRRADAFVLTSLREPGRRSLHLANGTARGGVCRLDARVRRSQAKRRAGPGYCGPLRCARHPRGFTVHWDFISSADEAERLVSFAIANGAEILNVVPRLTSGRTRQASRS